MGEENGEKNDIIEFKKNEEGVKKLGGLLIIGTERHDSMRIDNQLRGRSGRQGDPGTSRFFISLEDNLFRIFGENKVGKQLKEWGKLDPNMPLESTFLNSSVIKAQQKVEDLYYD